MLHLRFRWVSLQLQYLCLIIKEDTVWKRLGELPATLRDLYNETYVKRLGNYAEDDRQTAEAILRLLMCLREPLGTKSFLLALEYYGEESTSITVEVLLDLCANFVILDTELDVFRFAHLSIREFLEQKEEFDAASNHAIAAELCLRYLLDVESRYEVKLGGRRIRWLQKGRERPSNQHRAIFRNLCHEYVCLYWPSHLSESNAHRHGSPLKGLFWDFVRDDQNSVTRQFMYWLDLLRSGEGQLRLAGWRNNNVHRLTLYGTWNPDNLIFVASAWNFCDVLEYCISMDSHIVHVKCCLTLTTPLHMACLHGNVDGTKLLVDNGAQIEALDDDGRTPMWRAIESGHTAIVRLLLEKGANPDSEPSNGDDTYLYHAASDGYIDIVGSLLDAGADPNWGGEYAKTALDMAIFHGNLAMVRMILKSSGQTNEAMNIPWIRAYQLIRAVIDGDEAGVGRILKEWPVTETFAPYLNMALWKAASLNQKTSIRLLLAKGADMDSQFRGDPVLFAAATLPPACSLPDERKFPLVQFLLRQGANPHLIDETGQTLLHRATYFNKSELTRIVLEEGADVNQASHRPPPLLPAAYRGYLDVARVLLEWGADTEITGTLEYPDRTPHSPLYWARKEEHPEMEQLLLEYGAKDGPESCPHQHEPGSCPYGHGPGVCPHELGRGEDTTDEQELFESDENQSDEASTVESEVS